MDKSTERLIVQSYTLAEAERVLAQTPSASDNWAPGYPFVDELAILPRFIADFRENGDPAPFGPYIVRRRSDGLAIGGLGFTGRPDADGTVEVGYGLIPDARGHGFATEALLAVIEIARRAGALIVRADTAVENVRSQNVLLKCGFREVEWSADAVFFKRVL
ncbi:GNAT family N-acetyltransferase [Subtercola sp. RTI3]|uniref:GNAT family N-acetyltransferase n=1 Tax=Subtercola sp. RTI3 TaxID=3048639 RepID=UPI002B237E7E|nr:GNAT family N-acetyltransferase [Subtercola sp. RTI3]MEA9985426.1 GNAT family N-acetyltransferase [Subtercola sp. RTI3]